MKRNRREPEVRSIIRADSFSSTMQPAMSAAAHCFWRVSLPRLQSWQCGPVIPSRWGAGPFSSVGFAIWTFSAKAAALPWRWELLHPDQN